MSVPGAAEGPQLSQGLLLEARREGAAVVVTLRPTVAGRVYEVLSRTSLGPQGQWRVERRVRAWAGERTVVRVEWEGRTALFLQARVVEEEGFKPAGAPCPEAVEVMLVLDVSRSLEGDFDRVKAAAIDFVGRLDLRVDRVGLVAFAGTARLEAALTADGPGVQGRIGLLGIEDGTVLHPAIELAQAQLAGGRSGVLRVMVVLSDGRVESPAAENRALARTAAEAARTAGARVVCVAFGVNEGGTNLMRELASGPGDFFHAPTAGEVEGLFEAVGRSLCRAGNRAPTVVLVSPRDGGLVPAPWARVPLEARATDVDGVIGWLEVREGGQVLAGTNGGVLIGGWRPPVAGVYSLEAQGRDDDGAVSVSAPVVVRVNGGPVVEAGPEQSVWMNGEEPVEVLLAGSVVDDGFGGGLAVGWRVVEGPGSVGLGPDAAAAGDPTRARVVLGRPGVYRLRLEASDGVLGVWDEVVVRVLKGNGAPVVWAGPEQSVVWPEAVFLPGAVSDDGLPGGGVLQVLWQGPAGVEFSSAGTTNSFARFAGPGVYRLGLRAWDGLAAQGGLASTQWVTITVRAATAARVMKDVDARSAGVGGLRGFWLDHANRLEPGLVTPLVSGRPGQGVLSLEGVVTPVRRAFLYWHGPVDVADPWINAAVTVNGRRVRGLDLGRADDNTWTYQANAHTFAGSRGYRAEVTMLVNAYGAGPYVLSNLVKGAEVEVNGASLVVFYEDGNPENNSDVVLVDGNDSTEALGFFPMRPDRDRPASVNALARVPGGYFVAGRFASANVPGRNGMARMLADGRLDTRFSPTAGVWPIGRDGLDRVLEVKAMVVQTDGRVVVGGRFVAVEGQGRTNLARLGANGSLDTAFNVWVDGPVEVLSLDGAGRIWVGGGFTQVNGQPRRGLARLLPSGALDGSFAPQVEGVVHALAHQNNGWVLVGGAFGVVGGVARQNLARLGADGGVDPGFSPGVAGTVRAVLVRGDGAIVIGGEIERVNGVTRSGCALLHTNGVLEEVFQPDLSGTGFDERFFVVTGRPVVEALAEHEGGVLVAGRFVSVNGVARGRIARLRWDGSLDGAFDPGAGPDVAPGWSEVTRDVTSIAAMVAQADGKVLVGGCFEGWNGGYVAAGVMRLQRDGSVDPTFGVTDLGWRLTVPELNYSHGAASLELHVSDGQPSKLVAFSGGGDPIWSCRCDAPVWVNDVVWLTPVRVSADNGRDDDFQIFAGLNGIDRTAGYWPPGQLAGLWDIVERPLPEGVLRPGLSSLSVRMGQLTHDVQLEVPDTDALSVVAALARLPVGQVRAETAPAVRPPTDHPPVAWPDRFNVVRGIGRQVLDVLDNDLSPGGGLLTVTAVSAPGRGACEITHRGSAVLYVAPVGFAGTETFGYTMRDPNGNSATGLVTVTVSGPVDAEALVPARAVAGKLGGAVEGYGYAGGKAGYGYGGGYEYGYGAGSVAADTNSTRGEGQFAKFYRFEAVAGDVVTLALVTTNFLSHVYLRDPWGELIASSAHTHYKVDPEVSDPAPVPFQLNRTNVLMHRVESSGTHIVEVTAHGRGESGPFVLRLGIDSPTTPRLEVDLDGLAIGHDEEADVGLVTPGAPRTLTVRNTGRVDLPQLRMTIQDSDARFSRVSPAVFALRAGQSVALMWTVDGGWSGSPPVHWTVQIDTPEVASLFGALLKGHVNPSVPDPAPLEVFRIETPSEGAVFHTPARVPVVVRVEPLDVTAPPRVELIARAPGRQWRVGVLEGPDSLTFQYPFLWREPPEGVYQLLARTRRGDYLTVSEPVLVQVRPPPPNSPPRASNDLVTVILDSRANRLDLLANDSDADADPLRVTRVTAAAGIVTTDGAAVFYTPPAVRRGTDTIQYEISDGRHGTARAVATVQVVAVSVTLLEPPDLSAVRLGDAVALQAAAGSPAGAISHVEFFANGSKIAQAVRQIDPPVHAAAWTPPRAGHYQLSAVAVAASGARITSAPRRLVVNATGQAASGAPPVARIDNLRENDLVREGLFEVRGAAYDPEGPATYTMHVRRPADDALLLSVPGGSGVTDGPLGTLDFTLLRNGSYVLELEVNATENFGQASTRVAFVLDSQAKVGQLTFTEEDLVVPVGGLPITILRTYDSLNTGEGGDLGPAWTFTLRDLDVQLDEVRQWTATDPDDDDPELLPLRVGGGRHLTLTLPDGRRATFRFALVPGPSDDGAPCFCYRAVWTPPPGVHATLEPMDLDTLTYVPMQSVLPPYWDAAKGTPLDSFEFRGFILTNADGTRYDLQAEALGTVQHPASDENVLLEETLVRGPVQLTRITKRTGEQLRFRPDGIDHYLPGAGTRTAALHLQRDPDTGRLLAVFTPDHLDPEGQPRPGVLPHLRYEYHPAGRPGAGQLAAVHRLVDPTRATADAWQPAYDTTHYQYTDPAHPHLLTATLLTNHQTGVTREIKHDFDTTGRWTGARDPAGRHTQLRHDPGSRREILTDAAGHTTLHEYDPRGNITRTIDPLGHVTTRAYDDHDNLLSETDPLGHTTTYAYDTRGHRLAATNALGHVTRSTHDPFGNPLTIHDPLGRGTTNTYDPAGNLLTTADTLGGTNTFLYDPRGLLISTRDPLGTITTNIYDDAGRLIETRTLDSTRLTPHASRFTYDDLGRRLSETTDYTDPDGQPRQLITGYAYDARGRLLRTTNDFGGLNQITANEYDSFGQLIATTDPAGRRTRHYYDPAGRRVQTVLFDRDGAPLSISRTLHDELGRPHYTQQRLDAPAGFNPLTSPTTARATRHHYDPAGRLIRTEHLRDVTLGASAQNGSLDLHLLGAGPLQPDDPATQQDESDQRGDPFLSATTTDYDDAGRVQATTDARGYTTTFAYDALGRRTALTNVLGHVTTYTYDPNGNLTAQTDARGHTTTYLHDALNRLIETRRLDPAGLTLHASRITYDPLGRRIAEIDPLNHTNRYAYDALGRLVAVTNAWATPDATWATYTYDQLGRQLTQTDALDRTTRYEHDALGRRIKRTLPGQQTEHLTYDPPGNLLRHVQFNGRIITNAYDPQNRLLSRHDPADHGAVLERFTYHPDGQRATMLDASGLTTFTYDAAGRLATNATPQGTIHYQYDATGLLTNLHTSTPGAAATAYTYDELGRLTNLHHVALDTWPRDTAPVARYTYDAVGNLSTVTAGNTLQHRYRYNNLNRLTNLVLAAAGALVLGQFDYRLDAAGHRTNLLRTFLTSLFCPIWRRSDFGNLPDLPS